MTVYARPIADISTLGAWHNQASSPSNLFAAIDETPHDEADFITTTLAGFNPFEDQFGNTNAYTTPNGTAATYRYIDASGGGGTDNYRTFLLFMPNSLNRATRTPLVVYFHGATATESQVLTTAGPKNMLDSWLDLGWAVVSLRLGTTVNPDGTDNNDGKWGNHAMRGGALDILNWLTARFATPTKGFLFYGFSAGGTNSGNTLMEAFAHSVAVAALAIIDPATNLRWCFDVNYEQAIPHTARGATSAIRTQIKNAYAIPNNTWAGTPADAAWVTAVDVPDNGHDLQQVSMTRLPMIPVYISASSNDSTVSKAKNADFFVARLQAVPWTAELVITAYGAGHGDTSHFKPVETNAFYSRALA